MKTRKHLYCAVLAWLAGIALAAAQGTAFTYQGQLNDSGAPVNGDYDLKFSLFTTDTGGTVLGAPITNLNTSVSNGLFTVELDFDYTYFTNGALWLQIGVRTNGTGSFDTLSPRQALTPAPFAVMAENVEGPISISQLSGAIPTSDLTGTISPAQLPGGVISNNESSVTLSNITVNGDLTFGLPAFIGCNFPFLFGEATNHLLVADTFLNFSAGVFAGNLTMTGGGNTGVGTGAMEDNTTGSANTGFGAFALGSSTTGGTNTAVGSDALEGNTAGTGNSAVGANALTANAAGLFNTALGFNALQSSANGLANTGIGYNALQSLTAGLGDIGIGSGAGSTLTSGDNDIYIGNSGSAQESDVIRIGFAQQQTYIAGNVGLGGATPQQTLSLNGGINVDQSGQNIGTVANALTFGSGSGEGIGSIRTGGYTDSYGLNFYTDFGDRMTILQHGNVGINTTNPTVTLEVNGEFMQVDGLGGVRCYIGDDGNGNDVQVGSRTSGVTAVSMYNATDNAYMHVYCSSITIEGGADLAEPFQISAAAETALPGAVLIIDDAHPGQLRVSDQPYDTRVAGVLSGANGIHPGIQMQQQGILEGGKNVALTGRVYVQVDASYGAIHPGDMLTTSSTPGFAMKVTDHARAQGAILGKAMTALQSGKGEVLTLVTLQ